MYDFIDKAKKVHGDKYDYSKVEYKNSGEKVCIICPKHGEFWQIANNHISGYGCPDCKKETLSILKRSNKEEFVKAAREVHGEKYDYSKVEYINNHTKVCIICPIHGEFWQTPNAHLQNHGCPECAGTKRGTKERFIEKSRKIHGEKYDYSNVVYLNNRTKVCIVCPNHGEFWQTPHNHLQGQGCEKCGNEQRSKENTSTTEQFIEKARKVHGDKYGYMNVLYKRYTEKVTITCPKHGDFLQTATDHLSGCGCPKCGVWSSKPEEEINQYIQEVLGYETETRVRKYINPYELDIYVPEKKTAIEYNGIVWHSEKFGKGEKYHVMKTEMCEKQGIQLIHIFEDEWISNKEAVKKRLRHILDKDKGKQLLSNEEYVIKEVTYKVSKPFLDDNTTEGSVRSTLHLACYHNGDIIGMMSFRKYPKQWIITRFGESNGENFEKIFKEIFDYFIRVYKPSQVKLYADRRWVCNDDKKLYKRLCFEKTSITKPQCKYIYKNETTRYPRKKNTNEKYYRIWDCGEIEYLWKNKESS